MSEASAKIKAADIVLTISCRRSLDPLTDFLSDPAVVEISVNRPGHVYIERLGADVMEHHEIPTLTTAEIENIGERVAGATHQFISRANPILTAALPTGERIQIVLPPAAPTAAPSRSASRSTSDFTLEEYRDNGSLEKVSVAVGGLSDIERDPHRASSSGTHL